VGGTANDKTIRDGQPVTSKDPASSAKTPFDQGNNAQDLQITADIRKRVVDTNMSTSAHNVNIITLNGKVTLKGSVASLKEKETIEEIAHAVAGAESVQSQLEVK
jgi:osmotically-inducible protein OsmY